MATQFGAGIRGVRLDSGDTLELSKQVRRILDEAGMHHTRIVVSSDLDEFRITEMLAAGAPVDLFGVGTQLSVSYDAPTLGGVYKLVEQVVDGRVQYKMKLSAEKATHPGRKQVWRHRDEAGQYSCDIIGLMAEAPPAGAVPMLQPVMKDGRVCAQMPTLHEVRQRASENLQRLPERYRKIEGADAYPVSISPGLEALRQCVIEMIQVGREEAQPTQNEIK
jgi:nicotinate phosphoribosyltransferase